MTVIAFDGKTLAADKRAASGTLHRTTTKIFRVGDYLVGTSGSTAQGCEMVNWAKHGFKEDEFPDSQRKVDDFCVMIVIEASGRVLTYERTPFPIVYEDKICAIGSGRDFALAAMHLGCTAAEAVLVSCVFDTGCGNGVDELSR